jgi:transcription elongation GreA/GreB family factor
MTDRNITSQQPATEEWFLSRLEQQDISYDELMGVIRTQAAQNVFAANEWASLLREALAERGRLMDAVRVLHAQAQWAADDPAQRVSIGKAAATLLGSVPEYRRLIEHTGFDKGLPAVECIRRLLLILSLKPDTLCHDRTWGFGIVRAVDLFYGRVRVDFEKKPNHDLSLSYAAESLELLTPEHLLARIHNDPAGMRGLAQEQPAEVVRLALRSFGPLTIPQLQQILSPRLVPEADWKKFWESARKELKKDPRVEIPSKRVEPLRLHDKDVSRDIGFQKLAVERDMETILDSAEELTRDPTALDSDDKRQILADRLAFVVKGAGRQRLPLVAQAMALVARLKISAPNLAAEDWLPVFLEKDTLSVITRGMAARWVPLFFDFLEGQDAARFHEALLRQLDRLGITALTEGVLRLMAAGLEKRAAELFQQAVASQTAEVEFLYWLVRNPGKAKEWGVGSPAALFRLILLDLNRDYSGERLKVKNQLREKVERPEFLAAALADMSPLQREEIVQLVRENRAWDALDRQAVLGQIVRLYPELERVIASRAETVAAAPKRVTSHRSYRERQKQLEKLITVDIPQNSREIAIARSYGDLSENHEYKAAKEMQGILLKRRGELETMLHEVRPTDFQNVPTDRAGIGTSVVLRYEDGHTERYHILGEWDQDVERGIISSTTALAKALEGVSPGARVRVPSDQGERECTLEAVEALPPEILEWAGGGSEAPAS